MNRVARGSVEPGDAKVEVTPASAAGSWEGERGENKWIAGRDVYER